MQAWPHRLVAIWAVATALMASGCGSPPPARCLLGTYVLDIDDRVQLRLSSHNYVLSVGADEAGGRYEYNPAESIITFTPATGGIGEAARNAIHRHVGPNLNLDAILSSMGVGGSADTYDIAQDNTNAIHITADPDGINFVKKTCDGKPAAER